MGVEVLAMTASPPIPDPLAAYAAQFDDLFSRATQRAAFVSNDPLREVSAGVQHGEASVRCLAVRHDIGAVHDAADHGGDFRRRALVKAS